MSTIMEKTKFQTENNLERTNNISSSFIINQLSPQQLIDLAIDSYNDHVGLESRQELISRGKDNIQARISIKKACRTKIANLESQLETIEKENHSKEDAKIYKNRFLVLISIFDKLQLEWQKHDMGLKL